MKKPIFFAIACCIATLASCTDEEPIEVQKIASPGNEVLPESYYENLRAWKKTDHPISYMYHAAYAPLEGSSSLNKDYTSIGDRLISLPDSMDVVNLWMGVPMGTETDAYSPDGYDYAPQAYADMQYCREKKGIKFVAHADMSNYGHVFTIDYPNEGQYVDYDMNSDQSETCFRAYGKWWAQKAIDRNIDGVDFDFEGWSQQRCTWTIQEANKYIGPNSENPDMLLIVDYFSGAPSGDIRNNINFLVRQAYSAQTGITSNSRLSAPSGFTEDMIVLCEQWNQGSNKSNGGNKWSDPAPDGSVMYSLEAYARLSQTRYLGFGGFYLDGDYYFVKAPYYNLRRCIQIANEPVVEEGE